MPDVATILIIILLSVLLIAVIISIVIILKKRQNIPGISNDQSVDLRARLEMMDKQNEKTIQTAIAEGMVKLTKEFGNNAEKNQQNLNHFQSEINEFLQKRIDSLNKQMDEKISLLDKKVDDKLKEGFKGTSETMAQVRERLQAIDDAQKQMESLGKDVVSLKSVLEGNQSRGRYGEYQLKMVLHNVFGDTVGCYEEQYTMKKVRDGDDVRADAVVFMPEPNKMIAIDSKFPFQDYARLLDSEGEAEKETYKKDFASAVKKHITAIKDKYIVEGKTAPEALMFIPNDGVFAFIHHELPEVVDYAREKKVILTSPSTLPAILVTINMVRIEVERAKNAQEISKNLAKLGKDFEMFAREWDTLSSRLELATKAREQLDTRVSKITSKFEGIKANDSLEMEDDVIQINDTNK